MQIWDYILDTDDFVTTGQIRLNDDGTVDQRVFLSSTKDYGIWQSSLRWRGSENTAESVEANSGPFYELSRADTAY